MYPAVAIFFSASMLFMSAVLIRASIVSRRATRWHKACVASAVDRTVDRLAAGLGRGDEDTSSQERA